MLNLSNRFAQEWYGKNAIDSGAYIMYGYIGIAFGDIIVGLVSQYFKSRKKALYIFYAMTFIGAAYYFSPFNNSDTSMYIVAMYLGFSPGFWSFFVTMGAELFGTNLISSASTTTTNMVRCSLL